MSQTSGVRIHITGIVQGVGFRPFVYGLAKRLNLTGWVRNTSAGVDIEADGTSQVLEAFTELLEVEAPPLAQIDEIIVATRQPNSYSTFEILHSKVISQAFQPISPDVSICDDCLHELFDPEDHRYHYPFINCTNCGPRFTIIEDIPYDRPNTTMAAFEMCQYCTAEYSDPANRRFHAQPVACPECGPSVWLEGNDDKITKLEPGFNNLNLQFNNQASIESIVLTQQLLSGGKTVAIKGLGGFHLACDALNRNAVFELRNRKLRVDKPFALMMPDIMTIETHCLVNREEKNLLESRQRPVVILERRPGSPIVSEIAPGQQTIGVMLPYTPLHYLLFAKLDENSQSFDIPSVLVMTSGNLSEEPIAVENEEARINLSMLSDAYLMHNRPIHTRCDDSVFRVFIDSSDNQSSITLPVRRSRGYAPLPVHLPFEVPPILATGAELKNTFCLATNNYAFVSHHIGDLENYETFLSFENGITHYERLFRISPDVLAYDLHPDYMATRYALERAEQKGLSAFGIQHHHAHIAACMAENNHGNDEKVIGVSFDGTGYGEDGAIWGGEFLLSDYRQYERPCHLRYVTLPGGDKAIREPWRMALVWLAQSGIEWSDNFPSVEYAAQKSTASMPLLDILDRQILTGLNSPLTSSMGRLFDAVSALIGVRQEINYEAQAAIELEALVDPDVIDAYPFNIEIDYSGNNTADNVTRIIDPTPLINSIIYDLNKNVSASIISARFHNSVAEIVMNLCIILREEHNLSTIALSGGVWQNLTLFRKTIELLRIHSFTVLTHRQVPCNDGGISLGQAVIAARRYQSSL
ncbi:MAG: carbamoyltransferase HypF [Anaerolineales bacterium]